MQRISRPTYFYITIFGLLLAVLSIPIPLLAQVTTLSIDSVTESEGDSGSTIFTFTVTRTGDTSVESAVDFATADGTATTADNDYMPNSDTLTFPADSTDAQTIEITVNGDTTSESDEEFQVVLSNPTGATLDQSTGIGTITNDDPPVLTITGTNGAEGNSGTTTFTFTVTRIGDTSIESTVDFATVDGTATTADNDYVPNSDTLTFPAGSTAAQTIEVTVNGDTIYEDAEEFQVVLSNPTGAILNQDTATGIITNDDSPTVNLSATTVNIIEGGATADVTFTLSNEPPEEVNIDLIPDGQCSVTPTTVTLFSLRWDTGVTVTITAVDDGVSEGDHTCTIETSLSDSIHPDFNGLEVPDITGNITDNDDDGLPNISIADVEAVEGDSGTTTFTFTVTRSGDTSATSTVNYTTVDGTATSGEDYIADSGTLTFGPGVTSQPIDITVNGDELPEGDETFTVELSGSTNATISQSIGTGTITNDDDFPVISIADFEANEGDSGTTTFTFTVTRSGTDVVESTVEYETIDGSAIAPDDYAMTTGTITFAVGDNQPKTITVDVVGNTVTELDETFEVRLFNIANATFDRDTATGTILNDDAAPAIFIEPTVVNIIEGGASAIVNFKLSELPDDNVIVFLVPDTQCVVTPTIVTLTPANWENGVNVSIEADNDTIDEGDHTCLILVSNSSSDDEDFDDIDLDNIIVNITDDDGDPPTVVPTSTSAAPTITPNPTATPIPATTSTPVPPTSTPAPTATPPIPRTGSVSDEVRGLALRTGPYLGATLIGSADAGFEYPILARSRDEGGEYSWFLIQVGEVTGWVSGRYLTFIGLEELLPVQGSIFDQIDGAPDIGVFGTTFAITDMRRRPSGRSQIVQTLPTNTRVSIVGRTRQNGGDFWYQIRYGGQTGWIPAYLERGNTSDVPIR